MLYIHTGILKALRSLKILTMCFFLVEEQMQDTLRPHLSQQLGSFALMHTAVPRLLSTLCMFFSYLHRHDGTEVTLGLKQEDVTLQP